MSYINDCIEGKVSLDTIYNYIDRWNLSNSKEPIYQYLGMTEEDYKSFCKHTETLRDIVSNHIPIEIFNGEIGIENVNRNNLCLGHKNFLLKKYNELLKTYQYINLHYSGRLRRWRCTIVNEKSGTTDFGQYGNSLEEALANSMFEFIDYYNIKGII